VRVGWIDESGKVGDESDQTGTLEDDGRGIPPDERDRILEPGYSTTEDGTGFGLSIVQRAVEAHGWDLAVTESADGGGRFGVTGMEVREARTPE